MLQSANEHRNDLSMGVLMSCITSRLSYDPVDRGDSSKSSPSMDKSKRGKQMLLL